MKIIKNRRISREQRKKDLDLMNRITAKSKFTQKDIDELSRKIKKVTDKKFEEYCKELNNSKLF